MNITIWNENIHESRGDEGVLFNYPNGIHSALAEGLAEHFDVTQCGSTDAIHTATLQDPENGLADCVLDTTDVLLWWAHIGHADVSDDVVERVYRRVLSGMGLLVLHSGHYSKIFKKLVGATASVQWRNDGERELVWTIASSHPIVAGVPNPILIPRSEMYGEPFDIPVPDELVFVSSFDGGEVFRSGVTYTRGKGRIFYFSPGDQEYPVYRQPEVLQVLANGIRWAAPQLPLCLPSSSNPVRDWFVPSSS